MQVIYILKHQRDQSLQIKSFKIFVFFSYWVMSKGTTSYLLEQVYIYIFFFFFMNKVMA